MGKGWAVCEVGGKHCIMIVLDAHLHQLEVLDLVPINLWNT